MHEETMTNPCFRFLKGRGILSLSLAAMLLSLPSTAAETADSSASGITAAAAAQQKNLLVKGKVLDNNGQPVAGVAVILSGTSRGTTTDANGYYVIEVPKIGSTLEFSCLGYKAQKAVVPKSLALDIFLQDDTLEMEAAVVVGMGHQRKASVIGAISAIAKDSKHSIVNCAV